MRGVLTANSSGHRTAAALPGERVPQPGASHKHLAAERVAQPGATAAAQPAPACVPPRAF
eukprot:8112030-Alexandrium_andersonii.AAC.1